MKIIVKTIMILSLILSSNFISAQQHVEDYMFHVPTNKIHYKIDKLKRDVTVYSFYISQYPESIEQYRLYLDDLIATDSLKVKKALPNEAVLKACGLNQEEVNFIIGPYFCSDNYNTYPVIGLAYDQIKRYLDWKTEKAGKQALSDNKFNFNASDSYLEIVKSLNGSTNIPIQVEFSLPPEPQLISAYESRKTDNVRASKDSLKPNEKLHPVLKKVNIKDKFQYNLINRKNYSELDELVFDFNEEKEIILKNIHSKKSSKYCATTKKKIVLLKPWRVWNIKI